MKRFHSDGALILMHDESHAIHDMQDSMTDYINRGMFERAELVKESMKTQLDHIITRRDPFHTKCNVPIFHKMCAI